MKSEAVNNNEIYSRKCFKSSKVETFFSFRNYTYKVNLSSIIKTDVCVLPCLSAIYNYTAPIRAEVHELSRRYSHGKKVNTPY